MFPGPEASVHRNEDGEPIGWDFPSSFDDDPYAQPDDDDMMTKGGADMTSRFVQPIAHISRPGDKRPVTSYGRLVKRLQLTEASEPERRRAVQEWIDRNPVRSRQLLISLECAGYTLPGDD